MEDNKNVNIEGFLLDDSKKDKSIRSKNSSSLSLVPNALFRNMSHTKESINELKNEIKKELKAELSVEMEKALADDEGNELRLSRTEKLILLSLAYIIYTPELKSKKKKETENEETAADSQQTLWVNLAQLCGFVYGEEERGKPSRQKELKRILEEMSKKRYVILYKCSEKDKKGDGKLEFVQQVDPYFILIRERQFFYKNGKAEMFLQIIFQPIFFERITDRSCPMIPEMLNSNKTDIYLSLLPLVMNNRWAHIYGATGYEKVIEKMDKKDIRDPEKRKRLIERALTHAPISFDEINNVREIPKTKQNKEKEKYIPKPKTYKELQPVQKQRFKKALWEAMRFLIEEVGIITKKSYINAKNESIILVYNPDYPSIRKTSEQPDKDFWEKNPY